MITAIFILVALLALWGDYKAWRRWDSRRSIAIILLILNILPLIVSAITFIITDNTQWVMTLASWVTTLYTVTTLVRLMFYFGWFICRSFWLGVVVVGVVLAILTNGIINTRTDLTIKQVTVQNSKLPTAFDGFRIAYFSDLHIGSLLNPEREISALADTLNSLNADLVLFGGDMVHIRHNELTESVMRHLSRVTAPHGKYAILGNHDTGTYIKDTVSTPKNCTINQIDSKFSQMGWTLLRDSTVFVVEGRDSIAITGIDFGDALLEYKHSFATPDNFEAAALFSSVPDSLYNIALSHLPQLWHPISEGNYAELTLAGHTHATQIALEICGVRLSPAMLMYKEWSGLYSSGENSLYITDGIGCVGFYMRLGAKPEVTVIELTR